MITRRACVFITIFWTEQRVINYTSTYMNKRFCWSEIIKYFFTSFESGWRIFYPHCIPLHSFIVFSVEVKLKDKFYACWNSGISTDKTHHVFTCPKTSISTNEVRSQGSKDIKVVGWGEYIYTLLPFFIIHNKEALKW